MTEARDQVCRQNVELLVGSHDNERFSLLRHEQGVVIGHFKRNSVGSANNERLKRAAIPRFFDGVDCHWAGI